jgi:14-3-3 protein epsilon|nr:14-3-3 protein GF14 xi [Arabidopsis thaliana]
MENEQSTHVHFASLSSSSERYNETFEEIKKAMKKSVQLKAELSAKERNLVSVGYKNVISARRASLEILSSIVQKEESKGNEENVKKLKNYRNKVEDELAKICNDILSVINKQLIPSSTTVDSSVLFYNM